MGGRCGGVTKGRIVPAHDSPELRGIVVGFGPPRRVLCSDVLNLTVFKPTQGTNIAPFHKKTRRKP